ncbi:MAG TPA: signal peptidase I [Thermoanaerobaculia bacterium]|nr:signal peptidase I [Thermoanaerobaculia bacterium]
MKIAVSTIRILVQPLAIGLLAALLVRATLLQAYSIPSASMSPTLQPGDHILVTPARGFRDERIDRGSVVVFRNPDAGHGYFVKRVVAVPGDFLEIRNGAVRVNGRWLAEPHVGSEPTSGELAELVPRGRVFVMGDHRTDSIDSRNWGFLPSDRIVGRARLIFWSSGASAGSEAFAQGSGSPARRTAGPRWERIFRPIR